MSRLTKDEFILRMLSKITRKKWENYVVNRIIHKLDDNDIEFICQQYVVRPDGRYGLIDLYFPQFNIAVEVDEPAHENETYKLNDSVRTDDIVAVTGCDERRLKIKTDTSMLSLSEVNDWVKSFVDEISAKKSALREDFIPWDYEGRYDPQTHIRRGFIDKNHNVAFENHRDALRCFGYTKGHFQRAVWKIPAKNSIVWFPKFYENANWKNFLSEDGKFISEIYKGNDPKHFGSKPPTNTRVVFAHDRDALGYTLYRFLGEFQFDPSTSSSATARYQLISDRIDLKEFHEIGN